MKKIILTKGLPGSGKSTWAKEYVGLYPQFKRVNKDLLREMLDFGVWSGKNEHMVNTIWDSIIIATLREGYDIIVDDTNLNPRHETHLRDIAKDISRALDKEVVVQIMDFTHVPLETCMERDLMRANPVGRDVIESMYYKYIYKPVQVQVNKELPSCIICDLDGTLADSSHRDHYDASAANQDTVIEPVRFVIDTYLKSREGMVCFLSGREEKYRESSQAFLDRIGFAGYPLLMRATGDSRKDYIIKQELFAVHIKDKYNISFVLDDRPQVIRNCWEPLGLFVFKVGPWYQY